MYCSKCGAQINDDAYVCVNCGCKVERATYAVQVKQTDDTMKTLVKVFMILGCVGMGWLLIPLAWCIPMTVKAFRCMKEGIPMTTGFKVCTLLFVNLVAGIIMLCADDDKLT